jgi:hypothetical protein
MSIVLQSSSGGSVTIAEPTTASNFTQTLPAATGTLVLAGTTPTFNGITFPATQVPSADANTLDDYEEGTFTPIFSGSSGSITSYTASGYYVKVGRSITVTMSVTITTAGTAGGNGLFTGLPFTSLTTGFGGGARAGTVALREDAVTGIWYFGYVEGGSNVVNFTTSTNGGIGWGNGYVYVTSFVYQSAA